VSIILFSYQRSECDCDLYQVSQAYAPTLSIEQNIKKESIDVKRLEVLMSVAETRKVLEILADSSLQAIEDKENEQQQIEYKNT
jgi:hypothetical protein